MKKRLDVLIFEKGLSVSREKARALILSGNVLVNNFPKTKCGEKFDEDVEIKIKEQNPYVSRGGNKLVKALDSFSFDPKGLTCVDIGSSTGGFTDVLLKRGAKKVFCVDVGTNQLAYSLRQDKRVVVMEKTNAKTITPDMFDNDIALAVIDASFISLTSILEPVKNILNKKNIIALVKPQFEVGKLIKGFKGVVKNKEHWLMALEKCVEAAENLNLYCMNVTYSPITGPKGNVEFFLYLTDKKNSVNLIEVVENAYGEFK